MPLLQYASSTDEENEKKYGLPNFFKSVLLCILPTLMYGNIRGVRVCV